MILDIVYMKIYDENWVCFAISLKWLRILFWILSILFIIWLYRINAQYAYIILLSLFAIIIESSLLNKGGMI